MNHNESQIIRNCYRCGREFLGTRKTRICGPCRMPVGLKTIHIDRPLSFREKQVVLLVAQAKLNREIGHELHLTEGTIKEYINRIFKKLAVTNRTELAVWALTYPDKIKP